MSRIESWERAKDPDEILDFEFDYSVELDVGDTIATSQLTVVKGNVDILSSSNTGTAVIAFFTGGVDGETCEITNRIVTAASRTIERTGRLLIRRR